MFKLGNLLLSAPIILSPLAGISSYPYRIINRKMGFEFACTEMISARALSYSGRKTMEMLGTAPDDRPLGVQLLGKDPYYLLKSLDKLKDYPFDILNFNAACPRKKITNNGKGAYLLKEPKKLNSLLKIIVKNTSKPLILKMRLGWDSSKQAVEIALGAQDAGVSAICVHGRTRMQGYREGIDYPAIANLKKKLKITIIGSGDILTPQLAKKMFDQTGVDAITVARGALGNPWIFKEISEFLKNGKIAAKPRAKEIKNIIVEHFDLCLKFYGERNGIKNFRKLCIWYTRGFTQAKDLRNKITKVKEKAEMLSLIKDCLILPS
ncbi:MAG: tRNA dihydrouridine synthase DusB [Candidatus Omnitrophota bacterium]